MNCYILTGGESKRMGRSKADLFLARVAAAAREVFEEVFAVERAGGVEREIPTIFEVPHGESAPVFGVLRALEHAHNDVFVLAVDYARVTSTALRDLRKRCESSRANVTLPVWRGIPQTLCGRYGSSVAGLIRERIDHGRLDLRGLAAAARAEFFTYDAPELMNVNTPADLEQGSEG